MSESPALASHALPAGASAPLIDPGTTLAEWLASLAARMDSAHRHAFFHKMATLDRELPLLPPEAITLGRA